MKPSNLIAAVAIAAAGSVAAGAAMAEDIAPVPTSSVETYGAWKLQCSNVPQPAAKKDEKKDSKKKDEKKKAADKVEFKTFCEVVQPYMNRKSGNEIARLAFAVSGDEKKKGYRAVLRTLVDVSFEKMPGIFDGDQEIAAGKFLNCAGQFCYMTFDISKDAQKKLMDAKKPAFQFPLARGNMIRISMANKGLGDALNALSGKK